MTTIETGAKAAGLGEALPEVALEALMSRAKRAGFTVSFDVIDGQLTIFVCKWGMSRAFGELAGAAAFVDRVAGVKQ